MIWVISVGLVMVFAVNIGLEYKRYQKRLHNLAVLQEQTLNTIEQSDGASTDAVIAANRDRIYRIKKADLDRRIAGNS
jgi:hypothetical protein